MANNRKKTIAVDFDGVIHSYEKGYQDGSIYGTPIPGAFESIERLQQEGYLIVIYSCRNAEQIRKWIDALPGWGLVSKKIQIAKEKPAAIAYIDDRAIRFTNWADVKKYFV